MASPQKVELPTDVLDGSKQQDFCPVGLLSECQVVAVTGGAGFVGRHLVRALSRLGKSVLVIDLDQFESPEDAPNARYVHADLRDYDSLLAALEGVQVVFHLAGNASGTISVENPRFDFEVNAMGTSNLGNAALESGVRRLVYLSSAIVYGMPSVIPIHEEHETRPFLPYGASKLSGELALRSLHQTSGLPVVIARSFVIYGPGEDPRRAGGEVSQFLRWHLNGRPIPVVGDIDRKTRDFIHVEDLAAALLALADRGTDGGTYNVGSGEETSMRRLADVVGAATGFAARLEADANVLEDSFRLVADTARLRGVGFEPRIGLEAGIRLLAAELGERPDLPSCKAVFRSAQSIPPEIEDRGTAPC